MDLQAVAPREVEVDALSAGDLRIRILVGGQLLERVAGLRPHVAVGHRGLAFA